MPKYLLGVDNGGTVIKAGLFDLDGREIATASSKIGMSMPEPGWAERDADELWEANARAISEAIASSGVDSADILALAATGHGNGLYLVDAEGLPVYPGIYSTDTRAEAYVRGWYEDGTFERALPKTMQSLWAGQPAPLLAWFRDHRPEPMRKARWVLMCKDYVRFRLTGEAHAEITDMSGSSLMSVRDSAYDPELLRDYGIEAYADKLPPLRRSAELCGTVTEAAAAATGLKAGTPVAGGLFDIDACGIATGMTSPEQMCLVVGTWGINQYISPVPIVSKSIFMTSLYCIPGFWLVMEGSPTSAGNLEWFAREFLGEASAAAEGSGQSIYELCNEWVEEVGPDESQIIFLPFLYGTNAGRDAQACFLGLKGWHRRAHMLRAIYEGVIFAHKTHIERLLSFRDPPRAIRLTGGAARSRVWMQMFADVLQLPIEITSGTELGTLGAAICAGVAIGLYPSFEQAAAGMVRVVRSYIPDATKKEIYARKYAAYREALDALSSIHLPGQ